jgi:hypothetical protein
VRRDPDWPARAELVLKGVLASLSGGEKGWAVAVEYLAAQLAAAAAAGEGRTEEGEDA